MATKLQRRRGGFTLVEMLVVIVIIGILAALLLPAINYARRRALHIRIGVEIDGIEKALEAYKLKYGDYPPDFSNKGIVYAHIYKNWPRIESAEFAAAWQLFWADPADDTNHQSYLDPAEAIVFWLGGFSTDPKYPFSGPNGPFIVVSGNAAGNPDRAQGVLDMKKGRLLQELVTTGPVAYLISTDEQELHGRPPAENDLFPVMTPRGRQEPYVYFDSRTYNGTRDASGNYLISPPVYPPLAYAATTTIVGGAAPYLSDRPRPPTEFPPFEFLNSDTFQIISAGLDGNYGAPLFTKQFPSGNNFSFPEGDPDNITNFSDGSTLKDRKE